MQPLLCDMWVMERNAMRQFGVYAANRLVSVLQASEKVDAEQVRVAAATKTAIQQQKTIAVIPVSGVLEARPTEFGYWMGMSSYEAIGYRIDEAMRDESVTHIILDVSSPGGMVYGAMELADKIHRAKSVKPIITVANPLAASGAYWIGAAATRIVATPSSDVGSVGVIGEHDDESKALELAGVKVTYILSAGSPFKGEQAMPLTEEARAHMQFRADAIYNQFAGDLARFRGVPVDTITEKYGKGRVVSAKQALAAGMIDNIGTLQSTVAGLLSGRIKLGNERAEDNWNAPTPRELRAERVTAFMNVATAPLEITATESGEVS